MEDLRDYTLGAVREEMKKEDTELEAKMADLQFLTMENLDVSEICRQNPDVMKKVMEELQQCCDSLKPPYDEIANRFFYKEQSVAQIAQELDRNEKTVQTQIYRARAMLKKLYGKVQGREIRHG